MLAVLKGDVRLAITYWIFLFLPTVIFGVASTFSTEYGDYFSGIVLLFPFVYFPFAFVAVWNSANKYTKSKGWKIHAKMAVAIGAIALVINAWLLISEIKENQSIENLQEGIKIIKTLLPMKVDDETELTTVDFNNNTAVYNYKLFNKAYSEINTNTFAISISSQINNNICSVFKKAVREHKIAFQYNYVDKNGAEVFRYVSDPRICDKK